MGAWWSKRKDEDEEDEVEEKEQGKEATKYVEMILLCVLELTKIDTGDQSAVKNVFDDNVIEYLKEEAKFGFNYKYENMKMLAMVIAIAFAIGTVWHETPFPEDWLIIVVCAGAFFVMNSLLTGYIMFIERDIIARVYLVKENLSDQVFVRARIPQYKDHYNLTLQSCAKDTKKVSTELYIGTYFDEEGYFDQPSFKKDVAKLVAQYKKQKTE
ncbi:signal peptidase complex subunit 2 [Thraustotheca clavata]|uniref:Signal peptidase complex subunit 2 n=1 Tax=Thraustotheca clavata TaxID=74557 RepID=A0A1V9ZD11_9STRA|nr:signal peptidase complex subunit 2 [Thraustotheca clavata]